MDIQITDFNHAGRVITGKFPRQWEAIASVLQDMSLHLKPSQQKGIEGTPIFDPVGTNAFMGERLCPRDGWQKVTIPKEYSFLGKDVDFGKDGLLLEVQFSNYPFLLNNTMRAEILHKARATLGGQPVTAAVIVTKAKMFPASNSTLYYEQAREQLESLRRLEVFNVPIRLVGLFAPTGEDIRIR